MAEDFKSSAILLFVYKLQETYDYEEPNRFKVGHLQCLQNKYR